MFQYKFCEDICSAKIKIVKIRPTTSHYSPQTMRINGKNGKFTLFLRRLFGLRLKEIGPCAAVNGFSKQNSKHVATTADVSIDLQIVTNDSCIVGDTYLTNQISK